MFCFMFPRYAKCGVTFPLYSHAKLSPTFKTAAPPLHILPGNGGKLTAARVNWVGDCLENQVTGFVNILEMESCGLYGIILHATK